MGARVGTRSHGRGLLTTPAGAIKEGARGTNCGFLTIEQCRATVSGIGGFCEPNQFYNPAR